MRSISPIMCANHSSSGSTFAVPPLSSMRTVLTSFAASNSAFQAASRLACSMLLLVHRRVGTVDDRERAFRVVLPQGELVHDFHRASGCRLHDNCHYGCRFGHYAPSRRFILAFH